MWTENPSDVRGASCEYASSTATARGNGWLSPYVSGGNYCAVSEDLFKGGAGCGKCYSVSYDGSPASNPGRAGSAVIQVVNSGAGGANRFDCFINGFKTISGSSTGIFPIKFLPVNCLGAPPTAVILDGNNSFYVKVLFSGGATGVVSAKLRIGGAMFDMTRSSGATFYANTNGASGQASFEVSYDNGSKATIGGCFGGAWPVATSSICA